ncbi:MAG TPA: glycosyltransferase [Candidatus Saccharimonadales bacterium]|nr:glycosyltransferase [Candidatus Saccharimonadales bacterium]
MNISIIIPNYNGEEILQKNLPKVLESVKIYKKGRVEIIIPNDPSTDNSEKVIKNFIASIKEKHVIGKTCSNRNKDISGFSKNVNRGVALATGDILLLLNSDVAPHEDFLEPLLNHFEDPKIFGVGCMDESIEDGETILRGRGVASWKRGFLIHSAGKLDKTNTFWVSCGSGAFRKSIWDKIGGLNELYNPFYWEDVDLSYRGIKAGYKVLFEPKSKVIHEHEEGAINKNYSNYNKIKIVFRNQFTFVWINITDRKLFFSHIVWLPYHILKALLRRDKAFFWGLWHAILHLPQIMVYKEKMKPLFVVSDQKIVASVQK